MYALPIIIGVNIITFVLFFVVNTPDDMARMHLGMKRVSEAAIVKWKDERGYNKPILFNSGVDGTKKITETIIAKQQAPKIILAKAIMSK